MAKRSFYCAVAILSCLPCAAGAADGALPKAECKVTQSSVLSVSFVLPVKSFEEGKEKFSATLAELNALIGKQGQKHYQIQSTSYTVNSVPSPYLGQTEQAFQLSGSASYSMESAEGAYKLGKLLLAKNYQVGVTANKGYTPDCKPQDAVKAP